MNDRDPQTFRLFNPNALVAFGGEEGKWTSRTWVGNAWGSDHGVPAPGVYSITVRGEPRAFAEGERAIVRLDVKGRTVGVFDSPPARAGADLPIVQTRTWVGTERFHSDATAVFTFTFLNGNAFGVAADEGADYYGSCWQTFVDERKSAFPRWPIRAAMAGCLPSPPISPSAASPMCAWKSPDPSRDRGRPSAFSGSLQTL